MTRLGPLFASLWIALVASTPAVAADARNAAPGNPVAAVPLASLSATRDRPLFSPTRRPPPPPVVAAPPAPAVVAAPAAEAPQGPPFTLLGTLLGEDDRIGIFMNEHTRQLTRIHEGGADSGWTLMSIDARSAVMKGAGQVATLALPEKSANAPISLAEKIPGAPAYEPPPDPDDPQPPPVPFRRRGAQK